ncbi:MAG: PKD domain-containing protein [Candidatus Acetothermia bacterium]
MWGKKYVLLALALIILAVSFVYGGTAEEVSVDVEVRNTDCSEMRIAQFLFRKDGKPFGVKRFMPSRRIRRNQGVNFSFDLDAKPSKLALTGEEDGEDFEYEFDLNWGNQERETGCGRIIVEVPYKGGLDSPVARFEWSPDQPGPGDRVELDADESVGNIQYYGWDLDSDGSIDQWNEKPLIYHRWDQPGEYEVTLTVETGSGETAKTSNTVKVSSSSPGTSGLPHTEAFSCQEDAYFSIARMPEDYLQNATSPPHNNCWGHYKSHIYPLEDSLDRQLFLTGISARVTGGKSEFRSMKEGYKLQILPSSEGSWETLVEFSAPRASGKSGTLVHWKSGSDRGQKAFALRIVAPKANDSFVDQSALWVEYRS